MKSENIDAKMYAAVYQAAAQEARKKRYALAELLDGVDKKSIKALNAQVAPAMAGAPVGRELA